MKRSTLPLAWALLLLAGSASAQEAEREEPGLERVFVPKRAFSRVLARHPGGVLLTQAELEKLEARAAAQGRRAPRQPEAPAPLAATIQSLEVQGEVSGDTALISATAQVAVLSQRPLALPLPLRELGLEGVWVDGRPARVLITDQGPVVWLDASTSAQPRAVRWTFAQRVLPTDERGGGKLSFPLPRAAAASLRLVLPGDLELVPGAEDPALWTTAQGGKTLVEGACGGGTQATRALALQWRPRRAAARTAPYVTCTDHSLFSLRRGVVALDATLQLRVHRAPRQTFQLELPPGFVVRDLRCDQAQLGYLQRADRLELRLEAPRAGALTVRLAAELPLAAGKPGAEAQPSEVPLRPLRFLDLQRVDGLVGLAAGPDTLIDFREVQGLERADLAALPRTALRSAGDAALLRVYRRSGGDPRASDQRLLLAAAPQAAQVGLSLQAALVLEPREVKALVLYRFTVTAGAVFQVRARLPRGYALAQAIVRDAAGRRPAHRLSERALGERQDPALQQLELLCDLTEGLRAGDELLLTLEATRELPDGLAGQLLPLPRFEGAPMSELRGHLGLAGDPAFSLQPEGLQGLRPIPAEELPRVGLDVPGLVLGYRIEAEQYRGALRVAEKETRLAVRELAHHHVHERVLTSQLQLTLDVTGAPLDRLELLAPAGTGAVLDVRGPDVLAERELLGQADDGRD
ncbi:MAG TPA: hypothetical protein DEA08_02810, partial [Planctomycetes bacterium]|nr:hypothetical protein [Planctomycetota bacterium]